MSYDEVLGKAERDCEKAIEERDEAEEWVSNIYFMMLGNSPEWSNLFGFKEAHEEIKEARQLLGDAIRTAEARAIAAERARDEAVKALEEELAKRFDLSLTAKMLRTQAAELWPEVNDQGQVHFGRAIMESAAEAIEAYMPALDALSTIQAQKPEKDQP